MLPNSLFYLFVFHFITLLIELVRMLMIATVQIPKNPVALREAVTVNEEVVLTYSWRSRAVRAFRHNFCFPYFRISLSLTPSVFQFVRPSIPQSPPSDLGFYSLFAQHGVQVFREHMVSNDQLKPRIACASECSLLLNIPHATLSSHYTHYTFRTRTRHS